jgi:hypothetical protein
MPDPLRPRLVHALILSVALPFGLMAGSVASHAQAAVAPAAAVPSGPAPVAAAPTATVPSLELPVLVVDHEHRPVGDVKVDKLRIKMGAAAEFAPLAMRKEGEDPLSLVILVDASRDSYHDLQRLGDEFASLVGSELLPNDRVTIFAADCAMTRSLNGAAPDPAVLRKGFVDALSVPTLHGGQTHSACAKTFHLWDDVAVAVAALAQAPGRRVLFLISPGTDGGSKYDWLTVQQYAFDNGVAIFALRDQRQANADDLTRNSLTSDRGSMAGGSHTFTPTPPPRKLANIELLCANDGGLTLTSAPEFRKDAIADILFLIRDRYILTVPKDAYQAAKSHSAKVSQAALSAYFFSATGATEPIAGK